MHRRRLLPFVLFLILLHFNHGVECDAAESSGGTPPDYRFKAEVLATGLVQPMELERAADGRIFFNELNGRLRILHPSTGTIVEAGTVPVFAEQENGFLGFALDPAFERNGWIYLFYSPTNYVGQHLSRFQMRGDQLDLSSERVMLKFGEQRRECCHHAGSVEFGPDGTLYISTGDNTHPGGESDGYAPIDERPGKEPWDAQKSSANTHDFRGKILRIRPMPDGTYTIPDGNLFPKDGSGGLPEIFVMGCRNPWRMSVDSRTGYVYWGEVGPDAGGDGPRGSRGYDEINQARAAGNFGWPYFVGNNFSYVDVDFATKNRGEMYDPARPVNLSPNNAGATVLPPAQPALIYWPYGASREFPELGQGGRTACAGPVFRYQPGFRESSGFPEHFDGCLQFWDWQRPFLKWARLDQDSRLTAIEPFTAAVALANSRDRIQELEGLGQFVIRRPVDAQFGSDGCLYMMDYGETWGPNTDAKLIRISYQWGNLAPVAKASAKPGSGREPLTVQLSSAGTKDYEGDRLGFEWRLFPGNRLLSTEASPTLTISDAGNHVVELRVTDSHGASSSASLPLVVGNSEPQVGFASPKNGDFFEPGSPLPYKVTVQDAEDGSSSVNDELMDSRVFVNAVWNRGGAGAEPADPGLALMKQSDCFNCHAAESKIVGPSFLDVAARYRGQPGALDATVQRILKGSTGVWGEVPMLPHASLTTDQIQLMVRWVFGLEPGKTGPALVRGLEGTVTPPTDNTVRTAELNAAYTDAGRGKVSPLAGRATIRLRPRRLEAEWADQFNGPRVQQSGTAAGKSCVGSIGHGQSLVFTNLDLTAVGGITVRASSAGGGGTIEFRSGTQTGPLLGKIEITPTGGWDKWVEPTQRVSAGSVRSDLVLVFVNPGKGGLMNLDWIHLEPRRQ